MEEGCGGGAAWSNPPGGWMDGTVVGTPDTLLGWWLPGRRPPTTSPPSLYARRRLLPRGRQLARARGATVGGREPTSQHNGSTAGRPSKQTPMAVGMSPPCCPLPPFPLHPGRRRQEVRWRCPLPQWRRRLPRWRRLCLGPPGGGEERAAPAHWQKAAGDMYPGEQSGAVGRGRTRRPRTAALCGRGPARRHRVGHTPAGGAGGANNGRGQSCRLPCPPCPRSAPPPIGSGRPAGGQTAPLRGHRRPRLRGCRVHRRRRVPQEW